MPGLRDEKRAELLNKIEDLKKDPRAKDTEKCMMELLHSILILDERLSKVEKKLAG